MSTKSKVLETLENNREEYISGETLSKELGITRTAIWKAITSLKEDGYSIESKSKRGYKLLSFNDMLSEEGIKIYLNKKDIDVFVHKSIDSTNTEAKKLGISGYKHGTIIVSDEQTLGRGRFGRNFVSPKGSGIYLSVILRPDFMDISETAFSTILVVVAAIRALKKLTKDDIKIKWVNDLYVGSKKVSGTLTELVCDIESGKVDFIVAGIGINININKNDFPPEIQDIVSSVDIGNESRNKVIAYIVNEIINIFESYKKEEIIKEYKRYQLLIGKDISYEKNGEIIEGKAVDISLDGNLVVDVLGKKEYLHSGEVSVKWNKE